MPNPEILSLALDQHESGHFQSLLPQLIQESEAPVSRRGSEPISLDFENIRLLVPETETAGEKQVLVSYEGLLAFFNWTWRLQKCWSRL